MFACQGSRLYWEFGTLAGFKLLPDFTKTKLFSLIKLMFSAAWDRWLLLIWLSCQMFTFAVSRFLKLIWIESQNVDYFRIGTGFCNQKQRYRDGQTGEFVGIKLHNQLIQKTTSSKSLSCLVSQRSRDELLLTWTDWIKSEKVNWGNFTKYLEAT